MGFGVMSENIKKVVQERMRRNNMKMGNALWERDAKRAGAGAANMSASMEWERLQEIRQLAMERKHVNYKSRKHGMSM